MNISEFYKYSWFADLAYVEWNDNNLSGDYAIDAAVAAKRAPQKLAEEIFKNYNENYSVLHYHPNDDSGFKASLYGNGSEKVLSICGTEPESVYNSEVRSVRNSGHHKVGQAAPC